MVSILKKEAVLDAGYLHGELQGTIDTSACKEDASAGDAQLPLDLVLAHQGLAQVPSQCPHPCLRLLVAYQQRQWKSWIPRRGQAC